MSTTDAMTSAQREDRVLERIDKFRQRRPRLLDDVVTLAHGAGGKSSAALIDSVFLEAFRNDELEQLGDAVARIEVVDLEARFLRHLELLECGLRHQGVDLGDLEPAALKMAANEKGPSSRLLAGTSKVRQGVMLTLSDGLAKHTAKETAVPKALVSNLGSTIATAQRTAPQSSARAIKCSLRPIITQ